MAKVTITEKRDFAGGDASMLTACAVIMGAAIAQKAFLFSKRSNWNDAFFKSIIDSIKDAFKNILGIDGLGDQTKASNALYKAMEEVVPKLRSFKNAVEIDFTDDNREQEILNSLGFKLWRKVDKNNQEALVELLATFTSNMTPALKKEITDEGTDANYITDIISYADVIRDKNIAQEGKKVDKKTVTNDGIIKLNKIYNDVMKVAKHSANLYNEAKDPVSAEKFNYSKVLATLTNNAKGGGSKGGTPEAGK
jgi:hypothetical protein